MLIRLMASGQRERRQVRRGTESVSFDLTGSAEVLDENAQVLVDETKGLKRETRVLAFATVVLAITAAGQIITTLLA